MGGHKYFITFINSYSKFGWIKLLTKKSKLLSTFKTFKVTTKLKLGKRINFVHFDRGAEYYNRYNETSKNLGQFVRYLQECEIKASYTILRTSQQNGITEIIN